MDLSLSGKRVLVTAGAGGIGRVIAQRFLAEGARVAICDVDDAALADCGAQTSGLLALRAYVSVSADVANLFTTLRQSFGGLDVLVNNAGVSGPTKLVDEITDEEWKPHARGQRHRPILRSTRRDSDVSRRGWRHHCENVIRGWAHWDADARAVLDIEICRARLYGRADGRTRRAECGRQRDPAGSSQRPTKPSGDGGAGEVSRLDARRISPFRAAQHSCTR
jgi:hypothetical protein